MLKSMGFALLFLTTQIGVDAYMGGAAEYFNAWHVILAFVEMFNEGNGTPHNFIMGQAELGVLAQPVALAVLFAIPLLFTSILNAAYRVFARRLHAKGY